MDAKNQIDLNDPECPEEYKTGVAHFRNRKFVVNPAVLIPRIETEQIVDEVINFAKQKFTGALENVTVLEVGAGSGCISVSLAKELEQVKIIATDISSSSLEVARTNAKLHGVEDRISFVEADLLLNNLKSVDIIVANLPYIPSARITTLQDSVKNFEPRLALEGGHDGFEIYRKLFGQINNAGLKPKLLIIEIDDSQPEIALKEATNHFPDCKTELVKDIFGYPRFISVISLEQRTKIIAKAILSQNGRILLQLRDNNPNIPYPNTWSLVGGLVEPNEDPKTALIRECIEEMGIKITDVSKITERTRLEAEVRVVEHIYFAKIPDMYKTVTTNEGQCVKLFQPNELVSLHINPIYKSLLMNSA